VWEDLKLGEIVKVLKDEEIPADLLIIYAPKDIVFISTMNLDGETNLKERTLPFKGLDEKKLNNFTGDITCDTPNENLEHWDGNITSAIIPDKTVNCNIKNTLLRGCTLKNIEYCYGIVIYTGPDTKIMKNAKKAPRKISKVMKLMNFMLYTVFAFQISIVIIFASLGVYWTSKNADDHFYLNASNTSKSYWVI
jgi:magnesium-transporting ATPase (P-type)